jgi:hypothetical protein
LQCVQHQLALCVLVLLKHALVLVLQEMLEREQPGQVLAVVEGQYLLLQHQ